MTLAFFCLASLELLGALETAVSERNRKDWIEWIYAQQIKPAPDGSGTHARTLVMRLYSVEDRLEQGQVWFSRRFLVRPPL